MQFKSQWCGSRWGVAGVLLLATVAQAQEAPPSPMSTKGRLSPRAVIQQHTYDLNVIPAGGLAQDGAAERNIAGVDCPQQISTHTDANFEGPLDLIVFGGLFEGESVAASYTVDASEFPLLIDRLEGVFATFLATVETTTHWSAMVWEGTPDTGTLIGEISSDGFLFPHLVLPPGSNAATIIIEPLIPIIVTDNGTQTFSIGFRIDMHHQPLPDPCDTPPNCCNAFPAIDISGVATQTGNWLNGLNCGPLSCPPGGGWVNYQQMTAVCGFQPSGDWIMRASWTPNNCDGACCVGSDCSFGTEADCTGLGGQFQGVGTVCSAGLCQGETVACCFPATGGCLDLEEPSCLIAGGDSQGSALCADLPPCVASGACCFPTGFCLELVATDCAPAGGVWQGASTDCIDGDGDGTADACEQCTADMNDDGMVDATDLATLLGMWGSCP